MEKIGTDLFNPRILISCVEEMVNGAFSNGVKYLEKHDRLAYFIMNYIDISDRLLDLLIRIFKQENGVLSKRARGKEFAILTNVEAQTIEAMYAEYFQDNN